MCTIHEAWKNFISFTSMKQSSLKVEEYRFNATLAPYWEGKDLSTIKTVDILNFKTHLDSLNLSPQSVKHHLSLLQRIMKSALECELYNAPLPRFKMPKFDNRRMRALTKEEAQSLLEKLFIKNKLWHDIALFALHTGLRAGELFSLKKGNINIAQRNIVLHNTKSSRSRVIPLSDTALQIAEYYLDKQYSYLFTDKQITKVSQTFRTCTTELGLNDNIVDKSDKIVFHSLRHTFASWLVQQGVPILVVGDLLGHSTLQMTMRYSHLIPDQGILAVSLIPDNIGYATVSTKKHSDFCKNLADDSADSKTEQVIVRRKNTERK